MSERVPTPPETPAVPEASAPTPPPPPRRSPGHRGQDVRDTVAELAARAHEISLEAGSKMSSALKDVINAAAGITTFAVESARDLVQYMVRRGQMTQDEADKLIREAEAANQKRGKSPARSEADHRPAVPAKRATAKAAPAAKPTAAARKAPPPKKAPTRKPAPKK
jgi:polyhydroxyalkanoate synthesis regulator phasin